MPDDVPTTSEIASEQPGEGAEHVHLSFWQQPFVQNVLPFVTSVLIHAGIILIGFGTYKVVQQVTAVVREQVIIPDATIVEGAEVGGVPNPGFGTDPNIVSDVTVEATAQSEKLAKSSAVSVGSLGSDMTSGGLIGVGSGSASLRMGSAFGTGDGEATSPFGIPGGSGGMGPQSPFMGMSGNAHKVAYLCDASGSMLARRYLVIQALKESIDKLKPIQYFNVFFYHDGDFTELNKTQLVPATPDNKRQAFSFAEEMETADYTDPTPALRSAMAMKPQLIYLLTDGFDKRKNDFAKRLRADFKAMNSSKEVLMNVIYISDSNASGGPDAAQREEILSELRGMAEENGGRFKVVEAN